ncbi:hypothetical protein B484DRAFT_415622, partial [Ochromonadaceae sp. CCMP2298]
MSKITNLAERQAMAALLADEPSDDDISGYDDNGDPKSAKSESPDQSSPDLPAKDDAVEPCRLLFLAPRGFFPTAAPVGCSQGIEKMFSSDTRILQAMQLDSPGLVLNSEGPLQVPVPGLFDAILRLCFHQEEAVAVAADLYIQKMLRERERGQSGERGERGGRVCGDTLAEVLCLFGAAPILTHTHTHTTIHTHTRATTRTSTTHPAPLPTPTPTPATVPTPTNTPTHLAKEIVRRLLEIVRQSYALYPLAGESEMDVTDVTNVTDVMDAVRVVRMLLLLNCDATIQESLSVPATAALHSVLHSVCVLAETERTERAEAAELAAVETERAERAESDGMVMGVAEMEVDTDIVGIFDEGRAKGKRGQRDNVDKGDKGDK